MIKGLVKDTMVYGAGDFFFRLLSFAVFPIYAHIFSVEEYGTMALLLSMVGLICAVSELGMNNSVQRFYWDKNTPPMDRGDIVSTGLAINVGASLIFCFFLAGLFYFIRPLIWDRFQISYSLMILALMIVVPTQILEFAKNVLRLHFSPWKFTIVAAFRNGIGIALGLYLVWALDMRVEGIFWGTWWALVFAIPLSLWFIRRDIRLSLNERWRRELIRYGYPFVFAGLAFWIFSFSDRWMLGVLANGTEVGLYSIAVNFSGIVVFVTQAFGMAWSPFAMRLYSEEPEYKKIYGQVLSGLVFVIVWIAMGVTLFSPELMRLLTPREYWSASVIIGYLAMGVVFHGSTQVTMIGISLEKKVHLVSWGSWLAAALNLSLNALLIPSWGARGAAIATLLTYFCLTVFYCFWTQKLHPIEIEYKKIAPSLGMMGGVVLLTNLLAGGDWSLGIFLFKVGMIIVVAWVGFKLKLVESEKPLKLAFSRKG